MSRDSDELRKQYRRLIEGPPGQPRTSEVSLETLEALVHNRLDEASRIEALDRVLADPVARREYDFLMEIAAQEPKPSVRGPRWFAIAAAFFLVIGAGLVWRAAFPGNDNPLRSGTPDVGLANPADGATVRIGDPLVWHPVPGAVGYRVEVVSGDGDVVASRETTDTSVVLAVEPGKSLAGSSSWYVTARLPNGVEVRSSPRKVTVAP